MAPRGSRPVLGLDLGGSKIALRLERPDGSHDDDHLPLSGTVAADLHALSVRIARLTAGVPVAAVGLAHAPTLDAAGRVIRWPNAPQWEGVALRDHLASLTSAPVRLADDGCAAALADAHALGHATLLHLALGTGVGGGLVLGGALYQPTGGLGTEFGHMIVVPDGRLCTCGRRGCLQAYASVPAVRAAAGAADLAAVVAAERHDDAARAALDQAAAALALALTTLTEVFGPLPVTLSGGMVAGLPSLPGAVAAKAGALARPGTTAPRPVPSPHGAQAALAGACLLARVSL